MLLNLCTGTRRAPVFISIPSFLPLDWSSQQHLLVLLQKAGARLPNTGPDTEQRMFKSHTIWILETGRTTLGYPSIFKRAASLNSCLLTVFVFYLALKNKSETNTRACHWLGNANFWSRNPNYWIIIIIIPNNQY